MLTNLTEPEKTLMRRCGGNEIVVVLVRLLADARKRPIQLEFPEYWHCVNDAIRLALNPPIDGDKP